MWPFSYWYTIIYLYYNIIPIFPIIVNQIITFDPRPGKLAQLLYYILHAQLVL